MAHKKQAPADKEGNKYDKVLKENLEGLTSIFIRRMVKEKNARFENLPQIKIQKTIEREPDFLKIMYSEEFPDGCIVQMEMEGRDEDDVNYRMCEYGAMLIRKLRMPIEQFVLFIKEGKPKHITGKVAFLKNNWEFEVHCISQIDYREFLQSEDPEEVVFGILGSYNNEPPEQIIRLILERLVQLRGNSLATQKFIRQLEVISGIRKLQLEATKIIDTMSIEYDITQDVRYQQGQAIGIEKGIEKGRKEGLEKGETKKAITAIISMTDKGFDAGTIADLLKEPLSFVSDIRAQLLKREDILVALKKEHSNVEKIAAQFSVSPLLVEVLKENLG